MIITIISPLRFKSTIIDKYNELSLQGHVVLLPVEGNLIDVDKETEDKLMFLHRQKIDLSDEVLVLNVGGYMGRGTYEEIGYATIKGKPISYLVEIEKGEI